MSTPAQAAYAAIKNLENTGQIQIPEVQSTVTVGSINTETGAFTWSVPTLVQTTTIPPDPNTGQRTNQVISVTVGVIQTSAVDVLLQFNITGQQTVVAKAPAADNPPTTDKPTVSAKLAIPPTIASNIGNIVFRGSTDVTITGFQTKTSTGEQIILDAGLAASAVISTQNVTPPVTTFPLTVSIPNHPQVQLSIMIVRPPVLGMGAFTIPALPLAIVYAPPQGQLEKNSATYSVTQTFQRSMTTSITQSNSIKTAPAFTIGDLIGKVSGAITLVAALVGTGGAGAAGAGVLSSILSALGGSSGGNSTSSDVQSATSALNLFSGILNGFGSSPTTQTNTLTSESDNTVTIATTQMTTFTTNLGQGPGVGDIFVYFNNVLVVWVAVNGEVGINVLDAGTLVTASAAELQAELATVTGGGKGQLGLDEATLKLLISYDPYCVKRNPVVVAPPLVGPPRFIPSDQTPSFTVAGTNVNFSDTIDLTTEDKETQTTTQTTITDMNPGWIPVIFGADNTDTTTTMTFTTSQSTDIKTDVKISNTANFESSATMDVLDVLAFKDQTFGTVLFALQGSSVLQGVTVVNANPETGSTSVAKAASEG